MRVLDTQEQGSTEEKASPPYEEHSMTLSRIHAPANRFDIIQPASAPINDLDF
jgi:hypothetical protein